MIKEIKREYSQVMKASISSYICDSQADTAALPPCASGSSAFVADTGDVYVVNASGAWTKAGG